ncbi:MAG: aminopeptidase P family protein [Lentisphaeraceae bacterium]|nr:aminopeptidase P family protein [Lentisphaeraceae bacterium]
MKFPKEEFAQRRQKVLDSLGDDIYLLLSNYEHLKNGDVHFPFRQDSSFYYLTAFPEADSLLLLDPKSVEEPYVLFVLPKDRDKEIWEGFRYGYEGAIEEFQANAAWDHSDIESILTHKLNGRNVQFTSHPGHPLNERIEHSIAQNAIQVTPNTSIALVNRLRMVKSEWEIDCMKQAARVSCEAHNAMQKQASQLDNESELLAVYIYHCMMNGAADQGYGSIVASGKNATCLHYHDNNMSIKENDLVLVDAGCAWNNYSADITRTFPANGKFTQEQQIIYNAVLDIQEKVIAEFRPGKSLKELHD